MNKIRKLIKIFQQIVNAPHIELALYGQRGFEFYKYFTKKHDKLIFIQNKKYLIALLEMPADINQYTFVCKDIQYDVKKALKRGYRFNHFTAEEYLGYLDDIYAIHLSSVSRQNKSMTDSYTDKNKVREFCKGKSQFWGVFNINNELCAYAYTPVIGDVILINRIIGHQEVLKDGVMYLLVQEIVSHFCETTEYQYKWFMYDSFLGTSDGLTRYKSKLGFKPYNVKWKYKYPDFYRKIE
jgi:hypothetical protein